LAEKNYTILMTGGGAPGAAGIIRCLRQEKKFRIIAADANPNAAGRYLADDFRQIPLATDPRFTDELLKLCRESAVDIIMPLVTRELPVLAGNLNAFREAGTRVMVSDPSSLEIANDKSRLYQFLDWRGIKVPAYKIAESIDQFTEAVKELGYPGKTICFKPSISNGSRGFRIIKNDVNELDLLFNQKPNSTYIDFDTAIRVLSSGKFPELLISEYLPGEEYSVDCIVNRGEAVMVVPRLRKRILNGISVEGEFIFNENISNYCRQMVRELQLHGNIGIQLKRTASGEYLVLEINPRVQGTISAGLGAGINLPVLAVKQELGLEIAASEMRVKWGTKFVRIWQELFY
jgi:carbamoyl-phosphate synthase large subunit